MTHVVDTIENFRSAYAALICLAVSPPVLLFSIDNPEFANKLFNTPVDCSDEDASYKIIRNGAITIAAWPFWLPFALATAGVALAAGAVVGLVHAACLAVAAIRDAMSQSDDKTPVPQAQSSTPNL